jgi:hypothetical protein
VTRAGPRDHGEARAGRRAHKQPLASRRTEKSQRRHARRAIGGQCKCTDPCRARGLSKRIDAQGGPWGHAVGRGTRHVSMHFLFLPLPISSSFFLKLKKGLCSFLGEVGEGEALAAAVCCGFKSCADKGRGRGPKELEKRRFSLIF